jgi:hypothetical protein
VKNKRKLSNLLLNRGVQLRVTLYMVVVVALLYVVLGRLYWASSEEQTRMLTYLQGTQLLLSADDPDQAAYLQEASKFLEGEDRTRVAALFGALVVLVGLLFLGGLYLTHRIAGPVYAVSRHLEGLAEGRWRPMRSFRPHDQFTFLKDRLDAVVTRVCSDAERDVEVLRALEADPALSAEARERINAVIEARKGYLRQAAEEGGAGLKPGAPGAPPSA